MRLIATPPRCNVLTGSVASGSAGTSIAGASWHSTSLSIGRSTARVGSRACWPSRPTRFRLLQCVGCQTVLQRLGRQTRSAPRTQCGTQCRLAALPTWLLKPFVGGVKPAPNKRLKLTGGDRLKGSGVFAPWRARTVVHHSCARRRKPAQPHRHPFATLALISPVRASLCTARFGTPMEAHRSRSGRSVRPASWAWLASVKQVCLTTRPNAPYLTVSETLWRQARRWSRTFWSVLSPENSRASCSSSAWIRRHTFVRSHFDSDLRRPNKRLKLTGALVLKETVVLCPGGHGLSFNITAPCARVARSLSAIR